MHQAVSVEKRVAVALWCLAPAEYRTIVHLFEVARSTVCGIVHETCQAIVTVLLSKCIKFPSGEQVDNAVAAI